MAAKKKKTAAKTKAAAKKAAAKKAAAKKAPAKKAPAKKAPAKKAAAKKAHLALCSSVVVGPKRKDVLFAYRQEADNAEDTGWRFLRGDESEAFLADAKNCLVCPLDLVFAMDGSLESLVGKAVGSAWQRRTPKDPWKEIADYSAEP